MISKSDDLMLLECEEEPWGVSGIGVIVASIPFSKNKLDKFFNGDRGHYEYDTYVLGEKLSEISLDKGYDFLGAIDYSIHSIFYCGFDEMLKKRDITRKKVEDAIVDTLLEVSNASEEELRDLVDTVGIGAIQ